VFIIDEEAIALEAHKDMVLLLKEYARTGYKQLHGGDDTGFAELWRDAAMGEGGSVKSKKRKKLALLPVRPLTE
jgi:hypothetical protein